MQLRRRIKYLSANTTDRSLREIFPVNGNNAYNIPAGLICTRTRDKQPNIRHIKSLSE